MDMQKYFYGGVYIHLLIILHHFISLNIFVETKKNCSNNLS